MFYSSGMKHHPAAIKFCGFTRESDVLFARTLGVNYYGFVFYEASPRYLSPQAAAALTQSLSVDLGQTPVGLFVNHSPSQVIDAVRCSGVRVLQFHGNESADECESLSQTVGLPFWKAIHVATDTSSQDLLKLCSPYHSAQALLFDTASPGLNNLWGGTGHTFEWQKLAPLADLKNVPPLVLSGGLSAQNVAQGLTSLHPWAVDVSSGIEAVDAQGKPRKGIKDPAKMAEFVAACASSVRSI